MGRVKELKYSRVYKKKVSRVKTQIILKKTRKRLTEDTNEDSGEKESDKATDDHFTRAVPNAFLEPGEFRGRKFQRLDERVQVASLIAEIHPEPDCIVDDEESNRDRDREGSGPDTLVVADRSEKRESKSGVGTRHVAVGGDVLELPAMLHAVHDEFHELRDDAHDNRDEKNSVLLEELIA